MCRGVANYLVDTDRGVIKSDSTKNRNRQKYKNNGKVVVRKYKGKSNKYSVRWRMNEDTIRRCLD